MGLWRLNRRCRRVQTILSQIVPGQSTNFSSFIWTSGVGLRDAIEPDIWQELRQIVRWLTRKLHEQIPHGGTTAQLGSPSRWPSRCRKSPRPGPRGRCRRKIVLAADGDRSHHPLAEVIVNRQCALLAVAGQTVPAGQHITDRLTDGTIGQHLRLGGRQSIVELGLRPQGGLLPHVTSGSMPTLPSVVVAQTVCADQRLGLPLHGVQPPNVSQRPMCGLRLHRAGFVELPPCMRAAQHLLDPTTGIK